MHACSLPESALDEFNFYLDTQRLRIAVSNMKNANQRPELEDIKVRMLAGGRAMPGMHACGWRMMQAAASF